MAISSLSISNPLPFGERLNRVACFKLNYISSGITIRARLKDSLRVFELTHDSPKYLEGNLGLEEIRRIFPINYAILSFGKCLNY